MAVTHDNGVDGRRVDPRAVGGFARGEIQTGVGGAGVAAADKHRVVRAGEIDGLVVLEGCCRSVRVPVCPPRTKEKTGVVFMC